MSIWKFMSHLWDTVKHLFDGLEAEVKRDLPAVIDVVNKIKFYADTNLPDVLAAIIPGDADDKLIAKLRDVLPKVLLELHSDNDIAQLPTVDAQVRAIIAKIQASNPTKRVLDLTNLAGVITSRIVDDGKFSIADGIFVSQYIYQNKLNAKPVQSIPGGEADGTNE